MGDKIDGVISRGKLGDRVRGTDSILNASIQVLRDRGIIITKGQKYIYRLQRRGFIIGTMLYADSFLLSSLPFLIAFPIFKPLRPIPLL